MPTFDQLINEAQERGSREEDRSLDLLIKIRIHGKEDQAWKTARSIYRHTRVESGPCATFHYLNGEEITDGFEDDREEMRHSLDWAIEKPEVEPSTPSGGRLAGRSSDGAVPTDQATK